MSKNKDFCFTHLLSNFQSIISCICFKASNESIPNSVYKTRIKICLLHVYSKSQVKNAKNIKGIPSTMHFIKHTLQFDTICFSLESIFYKQIPCKLKPIFLPSDTHNLWQCMYSNELSFLVHYTMIFKLAAQMWLLHRLP